MRSVFVATFFISMTSPFVTYAGSETNQTYISSANISHEVPEGAIHIADMVHLANLYTSATKREDVERTMGVKMKLYYAAEVTNRFGVKKSYRYYISKFADWENGILLFSEEQVGDLYNSSAQIMINKGENYNGRNCFVGRSAIYSFKSDENWSNKKEYHTGNGTHVYVSRRGVIVDISFTGWGIIPEPVNKCLQYFTVTNSKSYPSNSLFTFIPHGENDG